MQTINGKLIDQTVQRKENLQTKIETIHQQIDKIEPYFAENQKHLKSSFLALKYLEQKLNQLEARALNNKGLTLGTIEQQLSKKMLAIITISLLGFSGLFMFLFTQNYANYCQSKITSTQIINSHNYV